MVTRLNPWTIDIAEGSVSITGLGLDQDLVAAVEFGESDKRGAQRWYEAIIELLVWFDVQMLELKTRLLAMSLAVCPANEPIPIGYWQAEVAEPAIGFIQIALDLIVELEYRLNPLLSC